MIDNINNDSFTDIARRKLKNSKPKDFLDIYSVDSYEEFGKLQQSFVCDKHGSFELRSYKFFRTIRVISCCPKCVDEFDLLVSEKVQEMEVAEKKRLTKEREEKRIKDLKCIGVSKRYIDNSFDNYNAETPEKQNALLKCKELCDAVVKKENPCNLIMVGGVGTGKTHLANSIVVNLFDRDASSNRINMIDMIRVLKSTWSKDSEYTEEEVIKHYTSIDLLIIDEVGIQFNSDTEKLFVFDIINGRYENCLPTVIISNLDINGVKDIIGDRCVDRLREDGGKVIAFNWESHR